MPYFPNKPGPDLLLDMLNDQLGSSFVLSEYTFSLPSVLADPDCNTAVAAEIVSGPLTGCKTTLRYNRLDLEQLLGSRNIEIIDNGAFLSVVDLLPEIASMYGIVLTASDVLDNELTIDSYPVLVNLIALPESYLVLGSSTIKIIAAV